jgi:hypothetical protein
MAAVEMRIAKHKKLIFMAFIIHRVYNYNLLNITTVYVT